MHPFSIQSIKGNDSAIKNLIESRKSSRISHAQLFLGSEGCPNLFLAMAYAKYLICSSPQENDSCGLCTNCKQFDSKSFPDMHYFFPYPAPPEGWSDDAKMKARQPYEKDFRNAVFSNPFYTAQQWRIDQDFDNKLFIIHVSEALTLMRKLSLKSYSGSLKVALIWLPEKMNTKAANKLLKVIEEPPKDVVLLFVSHDLTKVLGTIKSRVQVTHINKLDEEASAAYLQQLLKLGLDEAKKLALAYDHDIAKIIRLKTSSNDDFEIGLFADWMRHCFRSDISSMVAFAETLGKLKKPQLISYFEVSLEIIQRAFTYEATPKRSEGFIPDNITFQLDKFSKHIHHQNIQKIYQILTEALTDIVKNGNKKIILLDCSLKISTALKIPKAQD